MWDKFWKSDEVRDAEWAIAKQYFRPEYEGALLPPAFKDPKLNKVICLTHYFIQLSGKVYAISSHPPFYLKPPSRKYNTRVELAMDESGVRYAMKIEKLEVFSELRAHVFPVVGIVGVAGIFGRTLSESPIALDLGIAARGGLGVVAPDRFPEFYCPYFYLGDQTLFNYLEKKISLDTAYHLAIKLSVLLCQLHSGDLSHSGVPYAHLDLKPVNIIVDADENIHLIDFGFSEEDIHSKMLERKGTLGYFPTYLEIYTKRQLDVFALSRILFMPPTFSMPESIRLGAKIIHGVQRRTTCDRWIFADEFLAENLRLRDFLKKPHYLYLSMLDMARELTLLRCGLDDSYRNKLNTVPLILLANRLFAAHILIQPIYLTPELSEKIAALPELTQEHIDALCPVSLPLSAKTASAHRMSFSFFKPGVIAGEGHREERFLCMRSAMTSLSKAC